VTTEKLTEAIASTLAKVKEIPGISKLKQRRQVQRGVGRAIHDLET